MRFDCIERPVSKFFHRYGYVIAQHPWPFVVFPLLFTAAMSIGFLHLDPLTDAIYLFTPLGSPSKIERLAIHEKWPLSSDNYVPGRAVTQSREAQVIALARDGGNILEKPYAEAVYRLDQFIRKRVVVTHKGKNYTYEDLCLTFHGLKRGNDHVHILSDLYNHGFNITYPTFRFGTEGGYIGASLGGVTLMDGGNGTHLLSKARAWFMLYHVKFFPIETSYIAGMWENALGEALTNYPYDPYIEITYFHSQTLADELKRNADSLMPRFAMALTLLVTFSVLCSICFVDNTCFVDWALSKPILSILGVVNAGLGIIAACGFLLLVGMPFNDIVAVMPFLVVAVGTDNMFLMVAAVRRTPRSHSTGDRMAECMADAAVSILITATTDAFSFGIGAITTIPAVQIFCVYTGFAISFAFIFQITFFAALLALYIQYESEGRHSVFYHVKTIPDTEIKTASLFQKLFNLGSRPPSSYKDSGKDVREQWTSTFFRNWYAPILMNPVVKFLALFWLVVYLAGATYGCSQLKEGLDPVNLLVEDSYAVPHYHLMEEYFWKYGVTLQIVVNNAPDLRNSNNRDRLQSMIMDMNTTPHSVGMPSLQFWLQEMMLYYTNLDIPIRDDQFYQLVEHWLSSKKNNDFTEDIVWGKDKEGNDTITAFRFVIGMKDVSTTTEQTDATNVFRNEASKWPEYNITTFMPLWLFTDQYAIVVPNTIQNIIIALICMILIAFCLIPQPLCAFWVALACASIDFGVIGYMTLWGVNLDAISMITIIMSIGFSVDYAAHITYGYVVSPNQLPSERIKDALSSLGWPLCQGAMSTIISVVVLADVPAYMVVTFFKTVVLSITLGLLHGIVFLPVLLSIFVRGCCIVETPRSPIIKVKITPAIEKGVEKLPEKPYSTSSPTEYGNALPSFNMNASPIMPVNSYFHVSFDSPSYDNAAPAGVRNRSRPQSPELQQ